MTAYCRLGGHRRTIPYRPPLYLLFLLSISFALCGSVISPLYSIISSYGLLFAAGRIDYGSGGLLIMSGALDFISFTIPREIFIRWENNAKFSPRSFPQTHFETLRC